MPMILGQSRFAPFGLSFPCFDERKEGVQNVTALNSPEFRRHLRVRFSAAFRTRRATASRSYVFAFRVVEHFDVVEHVLASFIA